MIKHLNNFFKRIFNNEETVIFALIIIFTLIIFSFFAAILTPFIVSIVAAYLLVGLQKKIESYNVSETIAKILSFSIFIKSWFGLLILFGFTFALNYHFCNGIRHLFWDAGYGYEIETVYKSGLAVLVVSCSLTILIWYLVL